MGAVGLGELGVVRSAAGYDEATQEYQVAQRLLDRADAIERLWIRMWFAKVTLNVALLGLILAVAIGFTSPLLAIVGAALLVARDRVVTVMWRSLRRDNDATYFRTLCRALSAAHTVQADPSNPETRVKLVRHLRYLGTQMSLHLMKSRHDRRLWGARMAEYKAGLGAMAERVQAPRAGDIAVICAHLQQDLTRWQEQSSCC